MSDTRLNNLVWWPKNPFHFAHVNKQAQNIDYCIAENVSLYIRIKVVCGSTAVWPLVVHMRPSAVQVWPLAVQGVAFVNTGILHTYCNCHGDDVPAQGVLFYISFRWPPNYHQANIYSTWLILSCTVNPYWKLSKLSYDVMSVYFRNKRYNGYNLLVYSRITMLHDSLCNCQLFPRISIAILLHKGKYQHMCRK